MEDISSKLNALQEWLGEGLITQEEYEAKKINLTDRFMTETAPVTTSPAEDQRMRDEIINNIIPQFNQSAIEAGNIDPIGAGKLGDMVANLKSMSGWDLHQTYQTMMRHLNTQLSGSGPKTKIENFIGPEMGKTESQLSPDLWEALLRSKQGKWIKPPMFGVGQVHDITKPWERHMDLKPRHETPFGKSYTDNFETPNTFDVQHHPQTVDLGSQQANINPQRDMQPVRSSPVAGIPSYTYTPEGREGYTYGLKGGGSWSKGLQGILSLFSKMSPQWLTDLIGKTKGADEYVKKIIEPYDPKKILSDKMDEYAERVAKGEYLEKSADEIMEIENADTLSRLRLKDALMAGFTADEWVAARQAPGKHFMNFTDENPTVKMEDLLDLDFEQAKKLGYSNKEWQDAQDTRLLEEGEENWELVPEHMQKYSEAVKKQTEKGKKKGIFKLLQGGKDDDWSPPGLASGGIKIKTPKLHDIGLMKSLLKLGTTMGISEKELLEMAIKFNWDVSDKLKKQYGITDVDLKAKSDKGLEWLLLKANPDLAKQPYSESKVNKMLTEGLEEKKNGGLISLVR